MTGRSTVQHQFVDIVPDTLQEGVVYVCIPYTTAVHLCLCGCSEEVVTPIRPTGWRLTFDGIAISLHPSIGNWDFTCQSHYWISHNRVHWDRQWTPAKIEATRRREDAHRARHFAVAAPTPPPPTSDATFRPDGADPHSASRSCCDPEAGYGMKAAATINRARTDARPSRRNKDNAFGSLHQRPSGQEDVARAPSSIPQRHPLFQDHRRGAHDDETIKISVDGTAKNMQVSGLQRSEHRRFRKPLLRPTPSRPALYRVDRAVLSRSAHAGQRFQTVGRAARPTDRPPLQVGPTQRAHLAQPGDLSHAQRRPRRTGQSAPVPATPATAPPARANRSGVSFIDELHRERHYAR